ncbi:GspH/FimT family pseudopilin [Desulfosediminicola flagellatus]|uniref:GspH/FimT family pseudopilin n=1 Tax=Desulfosediminicola flagellatus TaxID=2569541 RepID=UPI0010AC40AD|nr:GspH/FimT family pseudopilin [Desulfosediminicola flagellatus]
MVKSRNGFSFIETVVVLMIISVLSVLALPSFSSSIARYKFNTALNCLEMDIQKAKMRAIAINSFVVIKINNEGYYIFEDNGAGEGVKGDWIRQDGENTLVDKTLPDNYDITTTLTGERTRFSGYLGMKAGSISLHNQKGSTAKVVISFNGRIRIERS